MSDTDSKQIDTKDYSVALITVPDMSQGERLAELLVGKRLAACVNIVPGVKSVYRWREEVCRDSECLLLLKTRTELRKELEEFLRAEHPYDVPELILLPVVAIASPYAAWWAAQVP